jgi:putative hydrolase of the HAD superfamily
MPIKALIFDLDDTLWPVAPVIEQAETALHAWIAEQLPAVTARYSIEALRERRQALVQTDSRFAYDLWTLRHTLLRQVFAEHDAPPAHADQAMQVFANARNQVTFFEDVMPALEVLKGNYILGSISNGFADIEAVGLGEHFSIALAAHTFGCAKPDSRIFLAMLERLQLSPHEVMYLGDDLRLDIAGAQQVGMLATWVNRRGISLTQTAYADIKPDFIVKDMHELLRELNLSV